MQKLISLTIALAVLAVALGSSLPFLLRGPKALLVYLGVALLTGWLLRAERIQDFRARALIGFSTGALMLASQHISILLSREAHLPLLGHLWRGAFIVAVAALASLILARFSRPAELI